MQTFLTYLFFAIYALSVVGCIVVIVTGNRNPLKTIPWVVVLLAAPGLGLFLYYFFGQDLRRERIISRRAYRRMVFAFPSHVRREPAPVPEHHAPLAALLGNLSHAYPYRTGRITPYDHGAAKMEALFEAIEGARHHIHILYYIICDDRTGRRLLEALVRKAREGVAVRVMYDDMGSRSVRRGFFDPLRKAGGEAYPFLPVHFPHFTGKFNYRNHRKIAVIDGRVGFLGGMNVADRYLDGPGWGVWRDLHFRIEGQGVYGLQEAFLIDWSVVGAVDPEGLFPELKSPVGGTIQIATGGPFGPWRSLLQGHLHAIANARRSIWIQTPYFLPSDALNSVLQAAALRGVEVRLMLPACSDSKIVDRAVHSFIDDMVRAGVQVSFFTAGFLHSKLLIVDDDLTVIGSANMDFRSFEHNFEVCGFVYDADFNAAMRRQFLRDREECLPLLPSQWFQRPRGQRFIESVFRMFSPLL